MQPQSITLPFDEERFWAKVNFAGPLPEHHPELGPCWLWTASTTELGYGWYRLSRRRKVMAAHRYSYERTYGLIPDGLLVCHACDRPGCVRPSHFRLGTVEDNNWDKIIKGRDVFPHLSGDDHYRRQRSEPMVYAGGSRSPNVVLNEDQVRIIRQRYTDGATQDEIAIEFGVMQQAISRIVNGHRWAHIDGDIVPPSQAPRHARGERSAGAKLTEETVREIRRRYAAGGVSYSELAEEFGVNKPSIGKIVNRQTWSHVIP